MNIEDQILWYQRFCADPDIAARAEMLHRLNRRQKARERLREPRINRAARRRQARADARARRSAS